MVDFLKRIILKEIYALFFLTPVIYLLSKLLGNQSLYAIKDVIMVLLTIQILAVESREHIEYNKVDLIFLYFYCFYIILATLFRIDDFRFWAIGLREVCVTPLMLIIIGNYYSNQEKDCLKIIKQSLYFSTMLTVVFSVIFFQRAYGSTNRLVGFWDSEHEPGIVGALLIVACIADQYNEGKFNNYKKLIIPFLLGGFCIILCKSRSCIAALFIALLFVFFDRVNLRNTVSVLLITSIFIFLLHNYENITNRSLDYNLTPRTNQYEMAWELIYDNFIFGIGIDKYGVMGNQVKRLYYGNHSTTTMDSSIIKYFLNLGFIYIVTFFTMIAKLFINSKKSRNVFAVILFGLSIGAVTGKLGAYPMNQYFYFVTGFYLMGNDGNPLCCNISKRR